MTPPEPPEVFAEPWQAQAFALTVALADAGAFDWPSWTEALAAALGARERRGEAIGEAAYFEAWVEALESLTRAGGLVSGPELAARAEAWREAYLHTPHGKPVELRA